MSNGTVLANNVASGTYTATCSGKYQLSARGGNGSCNNCTSGVSYSNGTQGTGGYVYTNAMFTANTVFTVVAAAGAKRHSTGGKGIGIKAGSSYIVAAGGGGGAGFDGGGGGGGWVAGSTGPNVWCGGACSTVVYPSGGGTSLSGATPGTTLGSATGGTGGWASYWTSTAGTGGSPYGGTGGGASWWNWSSDWTRSGGGGGGSGYCASGYTCAADPKGATAGTGRIVYCGRLATAGCP